MVLDLSLPVKTGSEAGALAHAWHADPGILKAPLGSSKMTENGHGRATARRIMTLTRRVRFL
jgi:hypothetical protein